MSLNPILPETEGSEMLSQEFEPEGQATDVTMTPRPPPDPNPTTTVGTGSAMLGIPPRATNVHPRFKDAMLFATSLGISPAYLHLGSTHFSLIDVERGLDCRDLLRGVLLLADAGIDAVFSMFTTKDIDFTRVHPMMIDVYTLLAYVNDTFPGWHDNDNVWDENVTQFNIGDFISKKRLIGVKLTTKKRINLDQEEDLTRFGVMLNNEIDRYMSERKALFIRTNAGSRQASQVIKDPTSPDTYLRAELFHVPNEINQPTYRSPTTMNPMFPAETPQLSRNSREGQFERSTTTGNSGNSSPNQPRPITNDGNITMLGQDQTPLSGRTTAETPNIRDTRPNLPSVNGNYNYDQVSPSRHSDQRDTRLQTPDQRNINSYVRLIKRDTKVPKRCKFESEYQFAEFKSSFDAFVIQQQMEYIIDPTFITLYDEIKEDALSVYLTPDGQRLNFHPDQFVNDKASLLNWLMDAVTGTDAAIYLRSKGRLNGLEAYRTIIEEYDTLIHREYRAETWKSKIDTIYQPGEDLVHYIETMRRNLLHYNNEVSRAEDQLDEVQQRKHILKRLELSGDHRATQLALAAENNRDCTSVRTLCHYLINKARNFEIVATQTTGIRSLDSQLRTTPRHRRIQHASIDTRKASQTAREKRNNHVFNANIGTDNNDSDDISTIPPPELELAVQIYYTSGDQMPKHSPSAPDDFLKLTDSQYQALPKDVKRKFRQTRSMARRWMAYQENRKTNNSNNVPKQYSGTTVKAQLAIHNDDDDRSTTSSDSDDRTIIPSEEQMGAFLAHISESEDTHFGFAAQIREGLDAASLAITEPKPDAPTIQTQLIHLAASIARTRHDPYVVCDNGAQISILGGAGDAYYIENIIQHRTINIIGAVPDTMRCNGFSIVTAVTKVVLPDGSKVLLRFYESAFNPKSHITLLSEYQVRENGCIIDSVPKNHRTSYDRNTYGTQSFSPAPNVTIPLTTMAALMTFNISKPSAHDLKALPAFSVTAPTRWRPTQHNSSPDDPIPALYTLTANVTTEVDPPKVPPDIFDAFHFQASLDKVELSSFLTFARRQFRGGHFHSDLTAFLTTMPPAETVNPPSPVEFLPFDGATEISEYDGLSEALNKTFEQTINQDPEESKTEFFNPSFTMRAKHKLDDIERVRPYLGWTTARKVRETLKRTTQLAKAVVRFPMIRHLRTRFANLRVPRLREVVATDTFHCSIPAYEENYTMVQENVRHAILEFIRQEGAPWAFRMDGASDQKPYDLDAILRELHVSLELSEPNNQQQNPAELRAVKWIKNNTINLMDRTGAPLRAWYCAAKYLAAVHNVVADESLRYGIPYTVRHGETVDISAFLGFTFCEKVYYLDPNTSFPETKEKVGYWLGISTNCGDALTYTILTDDTQRLVSRSVVRPYSPELANRRLTFNPRLDPDNPRDADLPPLEFSSVRLPLKRIPTKRPLKTLMHPIPNLPDAATTTMDNRSPLPSANTTPVLSPSHRLPTPPEPPPVVGNPTRPIDSPLRSPVVGLRGGNTEVTTDEITTGEPATDLRGVATDKTTNQTSNIQSNQRHNKKKGKKKKPPKHSWNHLRRSKRNAPPPTRFVNYAKGRQTYRYDKGIEFRSICPKLSRSQTKHMNYVLMSDYSSDIVDDLFLGRFGDTRIASIFDAELRDSSMSGAKQKEWFLKILWDDGNVCWARLADVRLDDPVSVSKFVKQRSDLLLHDDFKWVQGFVDDMKEHFSILHTKAKNADTRRFKFGIEIPRSVAHALWLDKRNGNNLWKEAIEKELKQIFDYKTFRRATGKDDLAQYKLIKYHIIFDVKFDLRHKARLVANGNMTDPTSEDVYSGVVAIESVWLAFAIAAINGLSVCVGDVGNAFLYARTNEKCYIIAGQEFGENAGQPMIIDKGLYGLRTSSARFHEHLAKQLREMGFTPSLYDTDLWIREQDDHYEIITTYVDDVLVFSKNPMEILTELQEKYVMKGVGIPEYYLGGNVEVLGEEWQKHGIFTALSANTYIKNATEKMEQMFEGQLPKSSVPMSDSYHPELDETELASPAEASKFRSLIGCANWIITLGRCDIQYATMALARFSMSPRLGHIKAMKKVFGYLKQHPQGRVTCDPNVPPFSQVERTTSNKWREYYPDATEELPFDLPTPRGNAVRVTVFVDADHAHDVVTRRSVTGMVAFVNGMIVRTYSKKQRTVESSSYGSELNAARQATDLIVELRTALRVLGVPLDGPAVLLGDNRSVVINTTVPSSVLKKKHCSISYHRVREAIAAGIMVFHHIGSITNLADILTKPLAKFAFWRINKGLLFRDHPGMEEKKKKNETLSSNLMIGRTYEWTYPYVTITSQANSGSEGHIEA